MPESLAVLPGTAPTMAEIPLMIPPTTEIIPIMEIPERTAIIPIMEIPERTAAIRTATTPAVLPEITLPETTLPMGEIQA